MKSMREWLNILPTKVRDAAFHNYHDQRADGAWPSSYELSTMFSGFEPALVAAFIWEDSVEGHDYWQYVQECMAYGNIPMSFYDFETQKR
jgi:transglutaminase-like putative cysteine protease